eukprot:m.48439 g.48439  ORF g.48439 m.48439 type:complete len:58 (+) comp14958_c0_seq4:661-834(+)
MRLHQQQTPLSKWRTRRTNNSALCWFCVFLLSLSLFAFILFRFCGLSLFNCVSGFSG